VEKEAPKKVSGKKYLGAGRVRIGQGVWSLLRRGAELQGKEQ